jgi:hypothetical protein
MDEPIYTEKQMQERLGLARAAAREKAWRDLMRRFTYAQRKHFAHLLAHDYTITAIEFEDAYGMRPDRMAGAVSREDASKSLAEERQRRWAEKQDEPPTADGGQQ